MNKTIKFLKKSLLSVLVATICICGSFYIQSNKDDHIILAEYTDASYSGRLVTQSLFVVLITYILKSLTTVFNGNYIHNLAEIIYDYCVDAGIWTTNIINNIYYLTGLKKFSLSNEKYEDITDGIESFFNAYTTDGEFSYTSSVDNVYGNVNGVNLLTNLYQITAENINYNDYNDKYVARTRSLYFQPSNNATEQSNYEFVATMYDYGNTFGTLYNDYYYVPTYYYNNVNYYIRFKFDEDYKCVAWESKTETGNGGASFARTVAYYPMTGLDESIQSINNCRIALMQIYNPYNSTYFIQPVIIQKYTNTNNQVCYLMNYKYNYQGPSSSYMYREYAINGINRTQFAMNTTSIVYSMDGSFAVTSQDGAIVYVSDGEVISTNNAFTYDDTTDLQLDSWWDGALLDLKDLLGIGAEDELDLADGINYGDSINTYLNDANTKANTLSNSLTSTYTNISEGILEDVAELSTAVASPVIGIFNDGNLAIIFVFSLACGIIGLVL